MDNLQHAIDFLTAQEQNFSFILEKYGPPNIVVRPEGFATLCKIIFEQQVSLESAKACFDKLNRLVIDFTPRHILNCSDQELRYCGLSRQKSTYIRALAEAIVSKEIDLTTFRSKSATEVRSELIKIKGIGNWTIDVYLMFSMQSPDVIPLGDIGVINTLKELWKIETFSEITLLTNAWHPHRTIATFFLWHYYLRKRGRVIHP